MITMCRYKFIGCKHCTLVGDIDNLVNYVGVGARSLWRISIPSAQFCSEPKTSLKAYLKKNTPKHQQ